MHGVHLDSSSIKPEKSLPLPGEVARQAYEQLGGSSAQRRYYSAASCLVEEYPPREVQQRHGRIPQRHEHCQGGQ